MTKRGMTSSWDQLLQAMRTLLRARDQAAVALLARQEERCHAKWVRVTPPPPGMVITWPHDVRALARELGFEPDVRDHATIDTSWDAHAKAGPPPHRPAGTVAPPPPDLAGARVIRDAFVHARKGEGAAPSAESAVDMVAGFMAAAEAGAIEAYEELAACYLSRIGVDHDPKRARALWTRGAELGDRGCALALADALLQQEAQAASCNGDDRALQALLPLVLRDDSDGCGANLAGYAAYRGFGEPSDAAKSLELHSRAAEAGNPDAMFELHVRLSRGDGVERDEPAALTWCRRAADLGQPRAAYNLGSFYARGTGVEQDWAKALEWYERAAQLGNALAAHTLAEMYERGEGVPADPERAARYRG